MKLYEILNEKFLGRKFKLIIEGIKREWIREVAINSNGKYGYIIDNDGIWNLNEGNLLCKIELIKTNKDKYERMVDHPIKVNDYEYPENYIEVMTNYIEVMTNYNGLYCVY